MGIDHKEKFCWYWFVGLKMEYLGQKSNTLLLHQYRFKPII